MVVENTVERRRLAGTQPRGAGERGQGAGSRLASILAFLGAAGLILAYALPGGAYDIVVRQEYGIVIWWVLGISYAVGLLPRARLARPTLILIAALVGYGVWTAISLAWSGSSERTVAEIARVLDYVGLVALIASVLDRRSWRAAAMGVGFAALAICALAVASRLLPSAFPPNAFRTVNGVSNRLNYPFGYWNAVGAWAAMSMAIGLAWSVHDHARVRRAVALGIVPVAALAAYLSYSRASIAGAAVAALAVVALSRHRLTALLHVGTAAGAAALAILAVRGAPEIANGTGTRGAAGVVGATLLAVAIAALVALLTSASGSDRVRLPRTVARFAGSAGLVILVLVGAAFGPRLARKGWHEFRHPGVAQGAADPAARLTQLGGSRYFYWSAAVSAFDAKPITGTGAGTYEFWWNQHAGNGDFVRNAHSFELENMAELGIPGVLLIVGVISGAIAVLARSRKRARRAASAGATAALLAAFLVYVVQASVDWMWQSTAVTVLALGCAAVAGARLSHRPRRTPWYARAVIAVAAAGAALVQVPGVVSTAAIRHSQAAERSGNAIVAYSWANAAVSAEPWAATPYEQRGLVLESAGHLDAAAADLARAVSHEPDDFTHWLLLSRIETEQGHLGAATRDYLRARALRPGAAVFYYAPYFSGLPRRR